MNFKTTLILLLIVLGLGFFSFWHDKGPQEKDAASALFTGIQEAKVRKISISRKAGALAIEQAKDGWRITTPLSAPASPEEIRSFLKNLLSLHSAKEVTEGTPGEFGLDAPAVTVSIEGEGANRTLKIGRATPWPGGFYARVEGGPTPSPIVAIEDDLHDRASRAVEAFRLREVVTIDANAVTEFELAPGGRPEEAVACQKEKDGWVVVRPQRAGAGTEEVAGTLDEWKRIRAERFVDDAPTDPKLAEYGLLDGAKGLFAKIRFVQPGADPLEIRVGAVIGAGDSLGTPERYVRVSGEPSVYAARLSDDKILRTIDQLRADGLLPLSGKKITAITIERKEDALSLQKQGEQWFFADARERPTRRADDIEVAKWLLHLQELKFKEFAKQKREADKKFQPVVVLTEQTRRKHGLDDPAATLTIAHKDGTEKLFVGRVEQDRCLVQRDGEGIGVWVKPDIADACRIRYIDLRDKAMTDLWAEGAYLLELRRTGKPPVSFQKQGAQWILQGDDKQTDRAAARDLARKLAKLEAEKVAEAGAVDWAQYGLDAPEAVLRAYYTSSNESDGDRSCTLLLGRPAEGGGRYARIEEDRFNHLFLLPAATADKILTDLTQ